MLDTSLLNHWARRIVSKDPSCCTGEELEEIVNVGKQMVELDMGDAEVHLAIAKACMYLDEEGMDYDFALFHAKIALELEPRNLEAHRTKRTCLNYFYNTRGDTGYLVELVDSQLEMADATYGEEVLFYWNISEGEFKRGFSHSPKSRGLIFFRLGILCVRLSEGRAVDTREIIGLSIRAQHHNDNKYINPLIREMYLHMDAEQRRIYRNAMDGYFKDKGNILPIENLRQQKLISTAQCQ